MKKKIALLLAAVMTVGSLPMTAFASTENTVSSIKTVEDGDEINAKVFLSEFKGIGSTPKKQTIRLTLNNAKFRDSQANAGNPGAGESDELMAAYSELSDAKDALAAAEKAFEDALTEAGSNLDDLNQDVTEAEAKVEEKQAAYDKAVEAETTAINALADAEAAKKEADEAKSAAEGEATSVKSTVTSEFDAIKAQLTGGIQLKYGSTTLTDSNNASDLTNAIESDTKQELTIEGSGSEAVNIDALKSAVAAYKIAVDNKKAAETAATEAQSEVTKKEEAKNAATSAKLLADGELKSANEELKAANQAIVDAVNTPELRQLQLDVQVAEERYAKAEQAVIDLGGDPSQASTFAINANGTKITYTKISDTEYMAEFLMDDDGKAELNILAEADGSGDATLTIESVDSVVSSQTLKIANIADGATTTTISGTTSIKEKGSKIKNVVVTETTAGTIEAGTMKLRLTNGFTFTQAPAASDIVIFPTDGDGDLKVGTPYLSNDDQDLMIPFTGSSKTAATISIGNLNIGYDEDDVEVGDECQITVSDAGTSKQSIVVGKASDYTVSFTAEDKDLPTFYAGTYSEDTDSLVVTLKEELEDAWITGRSTKIVFPEGVEVVEVNVEDKGNTNATDATNQTASQIKIDENEVDLGGVTVTDGKKAELELSFTLSVAPDFTGDIEATLTGSGIGDDQTVTVGTAAAPVTVDADINELKIDYRNTEASDIVITEADAGVLKKDTTVKLAIDGIAFDGDPTVEVESGDMKIENVKVKDDLLTFDIKTESQKEAAVIRVSDVNLYMSRSLPAGEYDLKFVTTDATSDMTTGNVYDEGDLSKNAIIRNYTDAKDSEQGTFDVDEITALKGYVTVVTAGRDQDDSTFTTKVTVTIGSDTMYAGTTEIKLDVPAYISNGYTMMPVRAVTEALSGSAIVRWDDPTKTVTITFGQRVISMTVGSNVMKINGVDVAMQAQCEITGERAFIPLRDLGYALGLNDSKIGWDDATKTATLN